MTGLRQCAVVVGERRRGPSGETLVCRYVTDSHVAYRPYGEWQERRTTSRTVWTSWPLIEESDP